MALHIGIALTIEELSKYLEAGMSMCEIAKATNRSYTTVQYWMYVYGLKPAVRRKKVRPCNHCGEPIERKANKYCNACIEKRVFSHGYDATLATAKTQRSRKKILIETRGHRCESCNNESWGGKPIRLELHHVDGNSDNNDESNLNLLCPNCHSLTPNYKGANMGNGSKRSSYRKKYYHRE